MEIFSEKHTIPKYSLITVNFRSAFLLGRMLRSFPSSFLREAEVLIVNNDVHESSVLNKMFSRISGIRIIEMERNRGFAQACNEGARVSRGKILFFLNPDIRYIEGPLMDWLESIDNGENSVILAPILIKNGKEEAWSSGQLVHPLRILGQNIFPIPSFWSWMAAERCSWASGAALAITRADFNRLEGFDEHFFLYYEDVDFCRRAGERGISVYRSSLVRFFHYGGISHTSKPAQKHYYFLSQDWYIRKYYGKYWEMFFRALRSIRFFVREI